MRAGLPNDDLFPIELLELRAQVSILEHFGGRHPTLSEMANVPDADLLKLSGVGPSTIRKIHSIIRGGIASSSAMVSLSDDELLSERDRLLAQLNELRDELKRQEHEFKQRLRVIDLELRVRGLLSK
jgi:hypothetical protein